MREESDLRAAFTPPTDSAVRLSLWSIFVVRAPSLASSDEMEFTSGCVDCSPIPSMRAAIPSTEPFNAAKAAGGMAFFADAACAMRPSIADIWPRISSNMDDERASSASKRAVMLSLIVEPRSTVSTREPRSRMYFAICVMSSRVRRSASTTSPRIDAMEDSRRASASLPGAFPAAVSMSVRRFCSCPSVASIRPIASRPGWSARSASSSPRRL